MPQYSPQISDNPVLAREAERAAGRGWSLIPLHGKRPTLREWTTIPDIPLDQLLRHVARGGNLGLRTGRASGIVVIDVDADGDISSFHLPPTVTVETGGDGKHYYFRHSEPIGNSVRRLGPGIDVRGDGGQVVFPGSIHPETHRTYRWATGLSPDDSDLAPLPDNILARMRRTSFEYCERNARTEIGGPIREGQRNDVLFRAACGMRNHGMGESAILAALQDDNASRCQPPLDDEELNSIAARAASYERGSLPEGRTEGRREAERQRIVFRSFAECRRAPPAEYLFDNAVAAAQPMGIIGPTKGIKTGIAVHLAASMATGTDWLNYFENLIGPRRVLLVSAESGMSKITQLALCRAGTLYRCGLQHVDHRWTMESRWGTDSSLLRLLDENLRIYDRAIQLSDPHNLDDIKAAFDEHEPQMLILDPSYMMLPAENANNDRAFARAVWPLTEMCQEAGCLPVLVHHTTKSSSRNSGDITLDDAQWSGFSAWVRQWCIVQRRRPYDPNAAISRHALKITIGGSEGHHGAYGLDVFEESNERHRTVRWTPVVSPWNDVRAADTACGQQEEDGAQRILQCLRASQNGMSETAVATGTGISRRVVQRILPRLEADRKVVRDDEVLDSRGRHIPHGGWRIVP